MDERSFDFEAALLAGELEQTDAGYEFNNAIDPWWDDYIYNLYDWGDPKWRKQNRGKFAWLPVVMNNGMFFMVSPSQYKRMMFHGKNDPKSWCAKIDRDPKTGKVTGIYARRCGRKDEPRIVYAHREAMRALAWLGKVDHGNRRGLDCRGSTRVLVNLRRVSSRLNASNSLRQKADGLPSGVHKRGKGAKGQQLYGGQYCVRVSTNKVRTIRSRKWSSIERAKQWYLNQLNRRFNTKMWVHDVTSLNYPTFPPRRVKRIEIDLAPKQRGDVYVPPYSLEASIENLVATF